MRIQFWFLFGSIQFIHCVKWNDEECMTDCIFDEEYYCWKDSKHWKNCKPYQKMLIEAYYPTNTDNKWCTTRCGYFGSSYEWCYTDAKFKNWDYCQSNNEKIIVRTEFNSFEQKLEKNCYSLNNKPKRSVDTLLKTLNSEVNNTLSREKRVFDYGTNSVNSLARVILSDSQTYQNRIVQDDQISITGYSTIIAPLPNGESIELTVRIRAVVRHRHLRSRTPMSNSLNTLMQNLDAVNGDERGHLIAASLGGTNDPYNIVPQHRGTNRRCGATSHWITIENEIRAFLNASSDRRVDIHVIVLYDNIVISRRPTGFYVQAVFYESDSTVNRNTGNCYFTNNPDGPSMDETDLGFLV
jgi:hypothetical protein